MKKIKYEVTLQFRGPMTLEVFASSVEEAERLAMDKANRHIPLDYIEEDGSAQTEPWKDVDEMTPEELSECESEFDDEDEE